MTYDLDNCLRSATALPIAISSGDGALVTLAGSAVNKVEVARAVDGSKFKLTADDRKGVQAFKHHKNYLDHVHAVSDKNGNLLEHYRYSAYGEVTIYSPTGQILITSSIENTILWNTRRQDTLSGFYLYKYRHCAPSKAWRLLRGESPRRKSSEGESLKRQELATRFVPSLAGVKEREFP